jgi:hypothetical protein
VSRRTEATCDIEGTSSASRGEVQDMRDIGLEVNDNDRVFGGNDSLTVHSNDPQIGSMNSGDHIPTSFAYHTVYPEETGGDSDTFALLESLAASADVDQGHINGV